MDNILSDPESLPRVPAVAFDRRPWVTPGTICDGCSHPPADWWLQVTIDGARRRPLRLCTRCAMIVRGALEVMLA